VQTYGRSFDKKLDTSFGISKTTTINKTTTITITVTTTTTTTTISTTISTKTIKTIKTIKTTTTTTTTTRHTTSPSSHHDFSSPDIAQTQRSPDPSSAYFPSIRSAWTCPPPGSSRLSKKHDEQRQ
jgi:hypothetical protein